MMKENKPIDYFKSQISEALWGDLDETDSFPQQRPLLAHYTSIATFEKIVSNSELWFSNPLFMNDLQELRFGMNLGASIFRNDTSLREACVDEENYRHLIASFDKYFYEYDSKEAFDTYVFCLANHEHKNDDGILSMWRGYGENAGGIAVVFDTAMLKEDESSPFIISRVHYGTELERRQWIEEKLSELSRLISNLELCPELIEFIAFLWLQRLKVFSLFSKHIGFSEEREWRIVYMPHRDDDGRLADMLSYHISNRGIEPKLKLKIDTLPGIFAPDASFEHLVARILLGPTISTPLAHKSIIRMLERNDKQNLCDKIALSTIPFRG